MKKIDLHEFARIELNPLPTLMRFFTIYALSAAATLLFCPQFGLGPLGGGHGISAWVMRYGDFACGAFCGFILYGFSAFIAFSVLRREESFWLRRNQSFILSALFLLIFFTLMLSKWTFGVGSVHESFSYYVAWIMMGLLSMFMISRVMTQWRLN